MKPRAMTNLTRPSGAFIGRHETLEALTARLATEKLITLTGTGGVGKTRLASELGASAAQAYSGIGGGGVWFCDLTEARSLEDLCAVIGQALDVSLVSCPTTADAVDQLGHAMAGRGKLLLILDNFEQVVAQAPNTLPRWLSLAPDARFLVTSREQLRLAGEHVFELGPLAVDNPDDGLGDAAQLFIERARAIREQDRPLAPEEIAAVQEIALRLEGIPLAIELAAARIGIMSPTQIRDRLDRRFNLLSKGMRGASARQATLRGAIDWSWELLRPAEREALCQCSVFRGGFTLEAAESVIALPESDDLDVMDALQTLREKSLLRVEPCEALGGEARFGLYESIREYAAQKRDPTNGDALDLRHACYYAGRGRAWAEDFMRHHGVEASTRLQLERKNISAAFERAFTAEAEDVGPWRRIKLKAVLALDPLLQARGRAEHRIAQLSRALGLVYPDANSAYAFDMEDPEERRLIAQALVARGTALRVRGAAEASILNYVDAAKIAHAVGDSTTEGLAICFQGAMLEGLGRIDEAKTLGEKALTLLQSKGDTHYEGIALLNLASSYHDLGQLDEAEALYLKARAIYEATGGRRYKALVYGNLAGISIARGDLDEAHARYTHVRDIALAIGDRWIEGIVLGHLGSIAQERGQLEEAERCLRDSLAILREMGARPQEGMSLGYLGVLLHEATRFDEARTCYQRAAATLRDVGNGLAASDALFHLSALYAAEGEHGKAAQALEEAVAQRQAFANEEELPPMPDLVQAHIHLAQVREAERAGDAPRAASLRLDIDAAITRATATHNGAAPWVERSDPIRSMLRLLHRQLNLLAPPDSALLAVADGSWFRQPGGDWVDFRRRRALKRLLVALVEHRLNAPGSSLTAAALIEAGWPDEQLAEEVGTNRLYVALNTLRKQGLRDALVSSDTGWHIEPTLPVFWSAAPGD